MTLAEKQMVIDALINETKQPGPYGYIDAKTIIDTINNLFPTPESRGFLNEKKN